MTRRCGKWRAPRALLLLSRKSAPSSSSIPLSHVRVCTCQSVDRLINGVLEGLHEDYTVDYTDRIEPCPPSPPPHAICMCYIFLLVDRAQHNFRVRKRCAQHVLRLGERSALRGGGYVRRRTIINTGNN